MLGKIEAYLLACHACGHKVDSVEVERRLARCQHCPHTSPEGCSKSTWRQWLPLLTQGGQAEAAALCEEWKP